MTTTFITCVCFNVTNMWSDWPNGKRDIKKVIALLQKRNGAKRVKWTIFLTALKVQWPLAMRRAQGVAHPLHPTQSHRCLLWQSHSNLDWGLLGPMWKPEMGPCGSNSSWSVLTDSLKNQALSVLEVLFSFSTTAQTRPMHSAQEAQSEGWSKVAF